MTNRLYVRVTLNGNEPVRELMLDGQRHGELDYQDLCAFIRGMVDAFAINPSGPVPLIIDGEEITLSFAEAIDTAMQITSSLRW